MPHRLPRTASAAVAAAATLGLGGCQTPASAPTPTQPPAAYVDALNAVFGKHPGARGSHAKGFCAIGHFVPNADAAGLTTAAFLQGGSTPVVARFSTGGGNPKASDQTKMRGMALRFTDARGEVTDLVAASAPVFFVGSIDHFIPYLEARRPDPATGKPDPAKVKAFNDSHADAQPQLAYLASAPIFSSYATTPYWAASAFRFTNAAGKTVHARWRIEPVAGRVGLSAEQLKTLGDTFLEAELTERLASGPARFDVWLQVAEPGDNVNDPSVAWPDTRRQVRMGQIAIERMAGQECDGLMFNPLTLAKGIAPSDDSTLKIRGAVYAESLGRRMAK